MSNEETKQTRQSAKIPDLCASEGGNENETKMHSYPVLST